MTEAQEVAAAFAGGILLLPGSVWLLHQAERKIRANWESIAVNLALSADPLYWSLVCRYLSEEQDA